MYESGFEMSSFRRCDTDERWWVTGGSDIDARYRQVAAADYEPVFVRLTGVTSATGEFGHLGAYRREIEVTRIIEIRALRPGECPGR